MTQDELNNYHLLMKKIATLECQITSLRQNIHVGSPNMDGLPHGSGISDRTGNLAIEITDLEERLEYHRKKAKESEPEIRDFVNGIDDDITRLVFKFRVMYGCSWSEVADTLGGYNTKGSVRARYMNFMKNDEETA